MEDSQYLADALDLKDKLPEIRESELDEPQQVVYPPALQAIRPSSQTQSAEGNDFSREIHLLAINYPAQSSQSAFRSRDP